MSKEQHKIVIEHAETAATGEFFIGREDIRLAEMVYSRVGDKRIIIAHTEVDEQLRGHGVARKLLDELVAWARTTETRVMATCPYAKAQFEKDASIQDVYEPMS